MKCQRCPKQATLHITEVLAEGQFEELHLCEDCAHKYLYEPNQKQPKGASAGSEEGDEAGAGLMSRECPVCGMKFIDFRNTGRLGCPHDYDEFKEELTPLLENIHGETRHSGKVPRRAPRNTQQQTTLIQLRNELKRAVAAEDYEAAARLRDQIKVIEQEQGR